MRSTRWRTILSVATLIALGLLGYVVRDQIVETVSNLGDARASVLLLVIPIQLGNYFFQGKLYQSLFRILGDKFRTRSMMRLAFEISFMNTVFPSGGVSGFSYISLRLRDEQISAGKASLVQMMRFVLIFIGFQLLLFIGLLLLAIDGRASNLLILVASSLVTLLLVGTLLLGFVIGSKERINTFFTFLTKGVNRLIYFFRPKHPETINIDQMKKVFTDLHENYIQLKSNLSSLIKPLRNAFLSSLCEILTLYTIYLAYGEAVNPGAVIIAYAVANFAGIISILPGGAGVYEFLMTTVMAAGGVPPAVSLPVTVTYRIMTIMIQVIPGYWFYQKAIQAEPEPIYHDESR